MIASSPCSPSFRRGSLISQLDFEDFLRMDKNTERCAGTDWAKLDREDITRKTLNSQSKSLQVVPDLISELCIPRKTTPNLEMQEEFKDLHLSWPKITVNLAGETTTNSFNAPMSNEKKDETVPRSPFLPRTSISEIDNLEILSPLFSITNTSPVIKTPTTLYEICCSSRKSSDDLSIYLPDNFTPASLESLDKSMNRTVFQFPATATAPRNMSVNDDVFIKTEKGKAAENSIFSDFPAEISECREQNDTADDASDGSSIKNEVKIADSKLVDIAIVKEKRSKKKRTKQEPKQQRVKRQKSCNEVESKIESIERVPAAEMSPFLRNKLERERRSDLNNRFQKLRESIPELATKDKASKIAILKAATDYVNELEQEEKSLEVLLRDEKARNQQLLKNLVNSTNFDDGK